MKYYYGLVILGITISSLIFSISGEVHHQKVFNDQLYNHRPWQKFFQSEKNIDSIQFNIPAFNKVDLKKGTSIKYLNLPEHEPVSFVMTIKGGAFSEPEKDTGIHSVWISVLENSIKDQLDQLELHGTQWSLNQSEEWTTLSIRALDEYAISDIESLLNFFASARLDEKFLKIARQKHLRFIADIENNPATLAFLLAEKKIWGNHPYRSRKIPRKIDFTIDDIKKWHYKQITSGNLYFYSTIDFNNKSLIKTLNSFLTGLNKKPVYVPVKKSVKNLPAQRPVIYHFHKEIPTSVILFAARGMAHKNKDYYSYKIANHIIGGDSFNSIIPKKIRVENGWAYASYSFYRSGRIDGSTYIFSQSSWHYTPSVLKEIIHILNNQEYLNEERIKHTKQSSTNRFVFLYKNGHDLLMQKINIEQDNLSESFLSEFTQKMNQTKISSIREAGKNYFSSNNFSIFIVGPAKIAEDPWLKKNFNYKEVTLRDILQ